MGEKKQKTGDGPGSDLFGWPRTARVASAKREADVDLEKWLAEAGGKPEAVEGKVLLVGADCPDRDHKTLAKALESHLAPWELTKATTKNKEPVRASGPRGPVWVINLPEPKEDTAHGGDLAEVPYGNARDLVGRVAAAAVDEGWSGVDLAFFSASDEEKQGALVGLELGLYRFAQFFPKPSSSKETQTPQPALKVRGVSREAVKKASAVGAGVNAARHLVNVPAGHLNPATYAEALEQLFADDETMTVEVWNKKRLEKEKAGLLLAVGAGAAEAPRLVHLRYRPSGNKKKKAPLAFVGKGVTFDSGGLDLKPPSGMRLMKKDMGGSAVLAGLALWLAETKPAVPCDLYLALAENAVDERSFRPGDILTSRSGLTVEVHNTDAEGRLVMADAIDVALNATGSDKPAALIDVATLTGAMRVGLGTRIAGIVGNHDGLVSGIRESATTAADPCWRLPLFQEYRDQLKSTFADVSNASSGRFGGAITAALFLENFVDSETPWAHLDLMAWAESAGGAYGEAGGNGQAVQALIRYLDSGAPGT